MFRRLGGGNGQDDGGRPGRKISGGPVPGGGKLAEEEETFRGTEKVFLWAKNVAVGKKIGESMDHLSIEKIRLTAKKKLVVKRGCTTWSKRGRSEIFGGHRIGLEAVAKK